MLNAMATTAVVLASAAGFQSSITPLPERVETRLKSGGFWKKGCPVALKDLRLLTVTHRNFNGRDQQGQLVVNKAAAPKLRVAFRQLHGLHFPIRDMRFDSFYGPEAGRPSHGDTTASFECRKAVPSPCSPGKKSSWSNHAYGLAVDVNPRENPYVGCGQSYNRTAERYRNRSRHLEGMVTPRAVAAFGSVGWGWGGAWSGNTKDYMHFSVNGG